MSLQSQPAKVPTWEVGGIKYPMVGVRLVSLSSCTQPGTHVNSSECVKIGDPPKNRRKWQGIPVGFPSNPGVQGAVPVTPTAVQAPGSPAETAPGAASAPQSAAPRAGSRLGWGPLRLLKTGLGPPQPFFV